MTAAAHFYKGTVMHCRFEPFRHRFRYGVFSLCFDLDRLNEAAAETRWFSHNHFNLMGFYDRDHGARDGSPLRPWVDGIQAEGPLQAILYEVRNTFGDKHVYFAPVTDPRESDGPVLQRCAKRFHVSPFLDIAGDYRFRVTEPEEKLSILIKHTQGDRDVLIATHNGSREAFNDALILKNLLRFPLMTLTVMAAIHWQALKLWWKGAVFHKRPEPPTSPVTRA